MRQVDPPAPAELAPKPPITEGQGVDVLDPELMVIPAPPQGQRMVALAVMAATVVAMLALVTSLRLEMSYALGTDGAVDLGEAAEIAPAALVSNSYVRLSGLPAVARAVHFRRGLSTGYVVFPLSAQRNVFVQVRDRSSEGLVRSSYSGRLVTFGDMGRRYESLAQSMRTKTNLPVTEESFLLLVDEPPSEYRWTWLVALLGGLFALLDAYFIVRWFKPLRWAQVPPSK